MIAENIAGMKLLILDDEWADVALLERTLKGAGFSNIRSILDPREFPAAFADFEPDLILLDLIMPHCDGYEILEFIRRETPPGEFLPTLVLTVDTTREAKEKALVAGARDFLTKPFDLMEAVLRVRNLLETRILHLWHQDQQMLLKSLVEDKTRDLEESRMEILDRLARAAEYRDDDTGEHTHRVGQLAGKLAEAIGLSREEVSLYPLSAPLHDIGKIGIPDAILLKPGKLTVEEYAIMRKHAAIGAKILAGSRNPILNLAEEIAFTHHEWWDGSGYPGGLAGEAIPLSGRIVAVADVYDALTHARPYKAAWEKDAAREEISRQAGIQFDRRIVEAFFRLDDAPA